MVSSERLNGWQNRNEINQVALTSIHTDDGKSEEPAGTLDGRSRFGLRDSSVDPALFSPTVAGELPRQNQETFVHSFWTREKEILGQ